MTISGICCSFKDERDRYGHGEVTDCCGNVYQGNDASDNEIRAKFAALTLGHAFTAILFRIPYRIFNLLSGGFVARGNHDAEHEFRLLRLEKSKTGEKIHCLVKPLLYTKHVMINLVKDIIKIATYPIAMVGLQIAAFFGMFAPLEFRVVFGRIEELWMPDIKLHQPSGSGLDLFLMFAAPCMQRKKVWQDYNLYVLDKPGSGNSLRNINLRLVNDAKQFLPYFEPHSKEIMDALLTLKDIISDRPKLILDTHLKECRILFDSAVAAKDNWIENEYMGKDPSLDVIEELRQKLQEAIQS